MPEQVLFTPSALQEPWGQQILKRVQSLHLPVEELPRDRLTGLRGETERETYSIAKRTLAVVTAPPSSFKLSPIPPSADWQFHLAEGCPAHCQYCYLAGSLSGPPVTRVYANLSEILEGLADYVGRGTITSRSEARAAEGATFEASCYTDPLGIEHLTGSLAEAIRHFGTWDSAVQLRFTTKFDAVEPLLLLDHAGRTRARFSVNAAPVAQRYEGGTARLPQRLHAMRQMALAGYPIGLTIAPIMPIPDWEAHYNDLLAQAAERLSDIPDVDLTVELITHRFTPGSKDVLIDWYPATTLEMDEAARARKTTKFGSLKYVYRPDTMRTLRRHLEAAVAERLPPARVLYWT